MAPHHDEHLKTTEARLARLSVLQELTVTALDLFDPESPADPFLERVAERLGCLAALWVAIEPDQRVTLVGAAGLSEASRALPFAPLAPHPQDPSALAVPYPELARVDLLRWSLRLHEPAGGGERALHALLLWFDPARRPPVEYLPTVERLTAVLVTVLTHRRLTRDLRESYEQLARAQLALVERERLAAIGELAAVLAHEVRNPLAVIFNCISGLEKGSAAFGEPKDVLGILGEEARRLNQIVADLLDFARPGAVLLIDESLAEIVASAIVAVRAAQPAPVEITLEAACSFPPQSLDGRLLRRAVINLLTNAIQATPSGGRVLVRVVEDSLEGRPAARIDVSDEGVGISAAVLGRIFEPFFTTKALGVGLGLAIVKHAAEAHHGEVTVRSQEGQGTTFAIRLPLSGR